MPSNLTTVIPPLPASRDEHWLGPKNFTDPREQAKSRTQNTVRYLYQTYVGPLDPDKRLDCACGFHGCINPFHHKPARPSAARNLDRARAAANRTERLKAQANDLDTQFRDLIVVLLEESPSNTVRMSEISDSLWMVVHTDPKTGERLPVTMDMFHEFLDRHKKYRENLV